MVVPSEYLEVVIHEAMRRLGVHQRRARRIAEHFAERKDMMDAVTYGGARAPGTPVAESVKAEPRKRFFARFMDALRETRRQQARRVIATHAHLLSSDYS